MSIDLDKTDLYDEAQSLGFSLWYKKYQNVDHLSKFLILKNIKPVLPIIEQEDLLFLKLVEDEENLSQTLLEFNPKEIFFLLKKVFDLKIQQRTKLTSLTTLNDFVEILKVSTNILVLTGAGVSVSCGKCLHLNLHLHCSCLMEQLGIPDFRSENGIYSRLEEFNLDDPQQMFDINYFKEEPRTFYSFAKEIYPSNFMPSKSHYFSMYYFPLLTFSVKLLEKKGKLLRNYTQNIDTLEKRAGIKNFVAVHGSFSSASCIQCKNTVDGTEIEKEIFKKEIPYCTVCKGVMKPDIVFFGESLPSNFEENFLKDRKECDLLIVIGSSLKVSPVAHIIERVPFSVPQVLINLEELKYCPLFDLKLLGKSDDIVMNLIAQCGWENEFEDMMTIEVSTKREENVNLFKDANSEVNERKTQRVVNEEGEKDSSKAKRLKL
ncbi:NAD-dependent histone deacetylase sir2 [Clydaea vesicula]|uniref:NAD-dependent histone deacetylase sir2 n=1 Tax=Clydaea vesicula TaxID=447962 RepID=A0AAD5Y103_9FUNG|nr:NAD-dependent histone deacetylase sir2 [Clydaea vesicula]KAJ3392806.1 NAD-dependent histone deacetylase sir2 [Lobulomyces angularis]